MPEAKFTWFPKLTATVAKVPEEQRGAILWALAQYGTYGVEPALEWPLDAIFESLREDIDNSKRAISSGGTGGRGNKKGASSDSKGPFANGETPLCECQNPACDHVETGVSETENGGSGDAEPIPSHTKPNHTKPSHTNPKKVFVPPSVDEVRALRGEGLHVRPGGVRRLLRIQGLEGREEPDEVVAGGLHDVAETAGRPEGGKP